MNKLDALIDACAKVYTFSPDKWFERDKDVDEIRRILEAVREDVAAQDDRSSACHCPDGLPDDGRCLDCPRLVFRATRAAIGSLS